MIGSSKLVEVNMTRTPDGKFQSRRLKRFLTYFLTFAFLIAIMPVRTLAWGNEGHEITALIAYALLNPRAKQNVDIVLEGKKIADVATWPDDLKRPGCAVPGAGCNPEYRPETSQWHFVDMPVSGNGHFSRTGEYCQNSRYGDCIVFAIEDFRTILTKSTNEPFAAKREEDKRKFHDALSFIVHFLGDIHQPLHCADDHDAGGNGKLVTWQNEPEYQWADIWNLHSVWDEYLVPRNIMNMEPAKRTYEQYANSLVAGLSAAERNYAQLKSPTIKPGSPENVIAWAERSHALARSSAYNLPPTKVKKSSRGKEKKNKQGQLLDIIVLNENYFTTSAPVVERQLRLGGVRLARILNEIYDKDIH